MKLWETGNKIRSSLYSRWRSMSQRCSNPKHKQYADYGGRGIKVCSDWLKYENFEVWARANAFKLNMTLDRKNNSKGYSPSNCRWITQKINNYNKRNNRIIIIGKRKLTILDASKEFNIPEKTLQNRVYRGWEIERALNQEPQKLNKTVTYKGKSQTLKEWSLESGIKYHILKRRIFRDNWSVEKAFERYVQ